MYTLINLDPQDWELLKELKLRSLAQEPIAFEISNTRNFIERSEQDWRDLLEGKISQNDYGERFHSFAKSGGGVLVGMITAVIPSVQGSKNTIAKIYNVFVDAEYRRQGIGNAMLSAILNQLSQKHVDKAILWVALTQQAALQLYRKYGFTEIGERQLGMSRVGISYDNIRMMKKIGRV